MTQKEIYFKERRRVDDFDLDAIVNEQMQRAVRDIKHEGQSGVNLDTMTAGRAKFLANSIRQ